jgi:Tol biopolymer transport system component/DNA-binding winged helix-turn-helix (wHTH) protein
MSEPAKQIFEFGPFRLDSGERVLLRDGQPVPITLKAFDVLLFLVENSGHVVEKDELMNRVWAGSFVEEGNLKVTVSMLRKVLEDNDGASHFIETVPRRGYRFVDEVKLVGAERVDLVMHERTRESFTIEEETAVKTRSRSLWVPLLLAGTSLVVVVVIVGFFFLRKPSPFSKIKLTRLTTTGRAGLAAISPDGKYMAHVKDNAGQRSIWLQHIGTGSDKEIASSARGSYCCPSFTHDGSYVYYIDDSNTINGLHRVPVLGGAATPSIYSDINSRVTLSPDDKQLAYIRGYPPQGIAALIVANADGSGERKLATFAIGNFFVPRNMMDPAWSPDGDVIVISVAAGDAPHFRQILSVRTKDGVVQPITSRRWSSLGQFEWFNDGSGLVFTASDEAPGSPQQIWYLSYPAGETRKLTNDLNDYRGISLTTDSRALVTLQTDRTANIWVAPIGDAQQATQITSNEYDGLDGLAFAPDGRVLFTSRANGAVNLWLTSPEGTSRTQLTTDSFGHWGPAVCANGRYVLFVSDRAGALNIWRMDIDGSNPKQLTRGKSEMQPDCSPDSQWVVYTSNYKGIQTLWRVSIDGGNPTQLTDYHSSKPLISPDGKQIACAHIDEQETPAKWVALIIPVAGGNPTEKFDIQPPGPRQSFRWSRSGREMTYIVNRAGVSNIWSQSLDGLPPKQLTDFKSGLILAFDWSPDGKQLALARGSNSSDVVLITDESPIEASLPKLFRGTQLPFQSRISIRR